MRGLRYTQGVLRSRTFGMRTTRCSYEGPIEGLLGVVTVWNVSEIERLENLAEVRDAWKDQEGDFYTTENKCGTR